MLHRSRLLALALVLVLAAAATPLAAADTYVFDKPHTEVSFQVRHYVSKVRGRFNDFEGAIQIDSAKPENSSVAFTIKAVSIDTANENRDKHLRSADFFDVEKFPDMTFQSSRVIPAGKDKFNVEGTLTMRGVSKPIQIPVTFLGFMKDTGGTDRAGFELTTMLNRKDFGINWNRALDQGGFMLSDDVTITINVEAVKKKSEGAPAK